MVFNHLSLPVRDLDEAGALFTTVFGFRQVDRKADAILVLEDEAGFTLVLSVLKQVAGTELDYPNGFHVGFFVEDRPAVDKARERIEAQAIR